MVVSVTVIILRIELVKSIRIATIVLLLLGLGYDMTILSLALLNKKTKGHNSQQLKKLVPSLRITHWVLGTLIVFFLILSRM